MPILNGRWILRGRPQLIIELEEEGKNADTKREEPGHAVKKKRRRRSKIIRYK
jgi:hypothetical protein